MKYLIIAGFSFFILSACTKSERVTDQKDYDPFLLQTSEEQVKIDEAEYHFWSAKLDLAPHQYPYMLKIAVAQNRLFMHTGQIEYLSEATRWIEKANDLTNSSDATILRALAKNYISQHRFTESHTALVKAETIGTGLAETEKMLFDIHMELGSYDQAELYLEKVSIGKNEFDYLIRKSKWEDHQGNLSETILYMNRALEGAVADDNKELIQWSITNLGDYYGHDGQIQKSYDCYLKALALDPGNAYAKKGIAWIVYSHERNSKEASRILASIDSYYDAPDNLLFQAEIAAYDQQPEKEVQHINTYLQQVETIEAYGNMYNKYNILLYADMPSKQNQALTLAQIEVAMRPTAQSYGLLAWTYFKLSNVEEAKRIVLAHIHHKTFEPEPLYIMAEILKTDNSFKDMAVIKAELKASAYELGPMTEKQILAL